ncbi:lasso peptide biosynthesis B2 protein [Actinophytocola sp.]|uniref:lasso peptide biosynthesis B2 protein n=1 Tax=Actinophytocola sp. TaxID=1872138 RepID=UPI00389B11A1
MSVGTTTATSRHNRLVVHGIVLVARILARCSPRVLTRVLGRVRLGARPAGYHQAAEARAMVTVVSARCRSPRGCLPRSIATALLCRTTGSWPTWCVGVRVTPPFGAHAWVNAEGRDVEEPYPDGYHRVLLRVPPTSTTTGAHGD